MSSFLDFYLTTDGATSAVQILTEDSLELQAPHLLLNGEITEYGNRVVNELYPVDLATTGPISLATGLAVGTGHFVDGVAISYDGMRILVKDQADPIENGIYLTTHGPAVREPTGVLGIQKYQGARVRVKDGTANWNQVFVNTDRLIQTLGPTGDPFNPGDPIHFVPLRTFLGGAVTGLPAPTSGSDAATKSYVDSLVTGLSWKPSVRAASTANVAIATLQNGSVVDGVTLATGDRVLLQAQTTDTQNGLYLVPAVGPATRTTDADTGAELETAAVFVQEGTTNANKAFVCTTDAITVGTTPIVWVAFATAADVQPHSVNLDASTVAGGALLKAASAAAQAAILGPSLRLRRQDQLAARAAAAMGGALTVVDSFLDFDRPNVDRTLPGFQYAGSPLVSAANIPGGALKLSTTANSTAAEQAYGPTASFLPRTDTGTGFAEFGIKLTTATIHASMALYSSLVSNIDNTECLAFGVFGAHSTTQFAVRNGGTYIDLGAIDTNLHSFGVGYVGNGNFQPYFDGVAIGAPVAFANSKTGSATPLYYIHSAEQTNGSDAAVAAFWLDYVYAATVPST